MSETTKKGLIDAATNAAEVMNDTQASRLQGVIQGYTIAVTEKPAAESEEKPS